MLLGGDCLAELLDDLVHVSDLSLNLGDDLSLGLLEENTVDEAPALASVLEGLHSVHNEFVLLLFLFDFEYLGDECRSFLLKLTVLGGDLLL